MTKLAEEIDRREAVFGKALCWLRLARGIPSLLKADRMYQEKVRPNAPDMEFGGHLSRYERGLIQPRPRRMLEILAVYGIDFADLETALEVMIRAARSVPALKRALSPGSALRARVERTVNLRGSGEADVRSVAVGLAQQALNR